MFEAFVFISGVNVLAVFRSFNFNVLFYPTEIWPPVQGHLRKRHEREAAGRGLPLVSEGSTALKLAC